MKKANTAIPASSVRHPRVSRAGRGFSLVELMIAMAVFVIVAGAAFSLFGQQAGMATQQQTLSGVNIGLRNAMSQMEMDMAGGGGNLLAGVQNASPFYLSVLVNNNVYNVAATCAPNTTNWSYPIASACFDSLTILSPNNSLVKPCTTGPVGLTQAQPLVLAANANLSAASTVTANDAINAANNAADIACFKSGDELLFIQPATAAACDVSGVVINFCMNVVKLTADATAPGGVINLQVNATGAQSSDPLGIIYQAGGGTNFTNALSDGFSIPASYVVNLGTGSNAVTYAVMANPSNANDPQLMRCPGTACTTSNAQVVTDQVVGFKVGADLWNGKSIAAGTDIARFNYDGSTYCSDAITGVDCTTNPPAQYDPYDFTLVRAVRVSLIGRTTPNSDQTVHTVFLNGFDNGPYLVQQASAVVDLRNLSNVDSLN
ncbi:MAG TPA: prepilin-type N-terminal cleavage/methylation domain-containing protein [Terriglobales bacterium]|nr:prepilin-type N-terminal cleavage/methylation domain-containing protein [Terriglobales bacterium]